MNNAAPPAASDLQFITSPMLLSQPLALKPSLRQNPQSTPWDAFEALLVLMLIAPPLIRPSSADMLFVLTSKTSLAPIEHFTV